VERAALPGRLTWRLAEVLRTRAETARVRTIVLGCPDWPGHRAGQHADVRLTAEDGYQAQRSYSIASAPEDEDLELTVERLEDGEVSPYLVDELRPGDELEVRGPIGGPFTWDTGIGGPLLMIAGGSGIVPFRSMLRHRAATASDAPARLLYSARTVDDLIYAPELDAMAAAGVDVRITLTRAWPEGWTGGRGRIDDAFLAEAAWPPERAANTYVCGPTPFVEAVASGLVRLGHDPARIRTERFGPTGG
jgi:ferredoxin-NADP reductase